MKEFVNSTLIILILLILSLPAKTPQTNTSSDIRSFNELTGNWSCKGISRNKDGSWKTDTTKATWVWFELFDGNAIQDIFYGGINYTQIDTASRGGSNIRIYNLEEKRWNMAWFDTNNRKIEAFTAVGEKDKIVMEGINAQGRHVKNIFSEISESHFNWTQYWTFDEGETWIDVAKIWCTKIKK